MGDNAVISEAEIIARIDQLIEKVVGGCASEQERTELKQLAEYRSNLLLPPSFDTPEPPRRGMA